jgi:hypothetical protein
MCTYVTSYVTPGAIYSETFYVMLDVIPIFPEL